MQYANSIITVNVVDSHYNDGYVFDLDKGPGFQAAFGLTYYDSNQEMIIEPDYGEIIGRVKSWNNENGVVWQYLDFRPCTQEELGISEVYDPDKAKFFPAHQNSQGFLNFYWKKLYCYDDFVDQHGNYNSADFSGLQISFVKCDSTIRDTCKSEEEIENFMRRMFILTLTNSIRFDQTDYKHKRAIPESRFMWHPIRSQQTAE